LVGSKIKNRFGFVIGNLIAVFAVVNLLPFITQHIFYSPKLFKAMFFSHRMQLTAAIDFINPFLSFIIASIVVRNRSEQATLLHDKQLNA
jgi:hypothetical protein